MKNNNSKRAFTLIELLVVVLIIGILSAIALPQYRKAVDKSRMAEAMGMVQSLHKAQEALYLATNAYSADMALLSIDIPADSIGSGNAAYPFKYYYSCAVDSCKAIANSKDLPTFEYHHDFDSNNAGLFRGKFWCQILDGGKNDKAKKYCASMGKLDTVRPARNWSWFEGNYFLLN